MCGFEFHTIEDPWWCMGCLLTLCLVGEERGRVSNSNCAWDFVLGNTCYLKGNCGQGDSIKNVKYMTSLSLKRLKFKLDTYLLWIFNLNLGQSSLQTDYKHLHNPEIQHSSLSILYKQHKLTNDKQQKVGQFFSELRSLPENLVHCSRIFCKTVL